MAAAANRQVWTAEETATRLAACRRGAADDGSGATDFAIAPADCVVERAFGLSPLLPASATGDVDARSPAPLPAAPLSADDVQGLWSFRVPQVSLDGTCSLVDKLDPRPFNLGERYVVECKAAAAAPSGDAAARLAVTRSADDPEVAAATAGEWTSAAFAAATAGASAGSGASPAPPGTAASHTVRLWRLRRAVTALAERVGAEWVGIYRVSHEHSKKKGVKRALLKEAYVGEPSRALFPLTEAFAEKSNNSLVALTKTTVVIRDTCASDDSGPYYECSGKVRSEFCAPILGSDGELRGIVDAEAWRCDHFTPERVMVLLHACDVLGRIGVGLDSAPAMAGAAASASADDGAGAGASAT